MYERYLPHIDKLIESWQTQPTEIRPWPRGGDPIPVTPAMFGKAHIYAEEEGTRTETAYDPATHKLLGSTRQVVGGVLQVTHQTQAYTAEELLAKAEGELTGAAERMIQQVLRDRGYIGTAESFSTYAASTNVYTADAVAFINWRAQVWEVAKSIKADVVAQLRTIPDEATFLSELPAMVWPV